MLTYIGNIQTHIIETDEGEVPSEKNREFIPDIPAQDLTARRVKELESELKEHPAWMELLEEQSLEKVLLNSGLYKKAGKKAGKKDENKEGESE